MPSELDWLCSAAKLQRAAESHGVKGVNHTSVIGRSAFLRYGTAAQAAQVQGDNIGFAGKHFDWIVALSDAENRRD